MKTFFRRCLKALVVGAVFGLLCAVIVAFS